MWLFKKEKKKQKEKKNTYKEIYQHRFKSTLYISLLWALTKAHFQITVLFLMFFPDVKELACLAFCFWTGRDKANNHIFGSGGPLENQRLCNNKYVFNPYY